MDLSDLLSGTSASSYGLPDLLGASSQISGGIDPVTITPGVDTGSVSDVSSGSDFWSSIGNAFSGALGQITGTALGVGTQVADYGVTSLAQQAAKSIGQSAGVVPPQYIPYAVPASSTSISSSTLLIVLALAGVGLLLVVKGK